MPDSARYCDSVQWHSKNDWQYNGQSFTVCTRPSASNLSSSNGIFSCNDSHRSFFKCGYGHHHDPDRIGSFSKSRPRSTSIYFRNMFCSISIFYYTYWLSNKFDGLWPRRVQIFRLYPRGITFIYYIMDNGSFVDTCTLAFHASSLVRNPFSLSLGQ